jgi:murein DD-endopeptidase MepM/ murein hydrolase activator NlpD
MVVPHSERAPVSFRLPAWLLPACLTLAILLFSAVGVLSLRSYRLGQEVRELKLNRTLQLAREREMRSTILTQQEEVRGLSMLVEDFQTELAGVSILSSEVRDLIGLPVPTNTPVATSVSPAASPYGNTLPNSRAAAQDTEARGGRLSGTIDNRSMGLAVEMGQDVVGMQVTLPSSLRELLTLRTEVRERMEKIDPEKRGNAVDLEKQLRLLAAAPHLWPTEARRLSSKFGYRTLLGRLEFHKGVDIPVWYGTKIHATKDGVVRKSGWQLGYGWTVEIEHEMGFVTIYGHNSKLLVSQGDEVKAGDVISLSGSSGRSTGPHVHYEIRLNDTSVDPLKYLDADLPIVFDK